MKERLQAFMRRTVPAVHTALYRATDGRIGGHFLGGAPVLLLTTVGRKSGRHRRLPLLYIRDGGRLVLVASNGGGPAHPGWYYNLRANPAVDVQIGRRHYPARADAAGAEEHARLWSNVVALYPGYARYQQHTTRQIPLVVLRRLAGGK